MNAARRQEGRPPTLGRTRGFETPFLDRAQKLCDACALPRRSLVRVGNERHGPFSPSAAVCSHCLRDAAILLVGEASVSVLFEEKENEVVTHEDLAETKLYGARRAVERLFGTQTVRTREAVHALLCELAGVSPDLARRLALVLGVAPEEKVSAEARALFVCMKGTPPPTEEQRS